MSNIEKVFKNLKKENKKALITYSVAGDPDLKSSEKIIRNFILEGVDIIEVGVPFPTQWLKAHQFKWDMKEH